MKFSMMQIQDNLTEAMTVMREFDWLINSFVLDFYVDNHWEKMPTSWKSIFNSIQPNDLAPLLTNRNSNIVWPLSLLAIRQLLLKLNIPREMTAISDYHAPQLSRIYSNQKIRNIVATKNIKLKKRHEIDQMSQVTARVAREHTIEYIVDFGSGLGHLARMLTYGYGLKVCCLEQQTMLSEQAAVLDLNLEDFASKLFNELPRFRRPSHLNVRLTHETNLQQLVLDIMKCFDLPPDDMTNFKFGIIGLHPCGDLAVILLNFFLNCPQAIFVNLVGCCYMKLTCPIVHKDPIVFHGYPLSKHLMQQIPLANHLSYEAREISCHAIEQYAKRLSENNFEYLKVHSYRAAIEKIICKHWPGRRRSGLKNIKQLTTFDAYCKEAVENMGITIRAADIESNEIVSDLANWKRVVIFYTLRLMFAPLIESIILYDRMLYSMEFGCETDLRAIFNPELSPRNHILTSVRP